MKKLIQLVIAILLVLAFLFSTGMTTVKGQTIISENKDRFRLQLDHSIMNRIVLQPNRTTMNMILSQRNRFMRTQNNESNNSAHTESFIQHHILKNQQNQFVELLEEIVANVIENIQQLKNVTATDLSQSISPRIITDLVQLDKTLASVELGKASSSSMRAFKRAIR